MYVCMYVCMLPLLNLLQTIVINRCGLLLSYDDKESVQDDWTYWAVVLHFPGFINIFCLSKNKKYYQL